MYTTYIIQSEKNKRYYIGSCENIKKRLKEHNAGKTKSTKAGVPWKIIVAENYQSRQEVYRREKQIKSYKGGEAFRKLINKWRGARAV